MGPAAVFNGVPIEMEQLEAPHDPDTSVSDDERTSSLFPVILHQLVLDGAREGFGVSAAPDEVEEGFAELAAGSEKTPKRSSPTGV